MDDLWTPLVAIGTWALAVATIVALRYQVKVAVRAIGAEAFSRSTERWDSPDMRGRRRRLAQALVSGGTVPENVILDVIDFFEDLGTALRAGSLSKEQAFNGFSTAARNYWAVCGQNFAGEQRKSGDPTFYTEFEYFVREMNRLQERKAGKLTDLTKKVLDEFLASEASLS